MQPTTPEAGDTLRRIVAAVAAMQRPWIAGGALVPMTGRDVAEVMGVSESTVSRYADATVDTARGRFPVRYFFASALKAEAGDVSSRTVRELILAMVQAEDRTRPLSDQGIADAMLQEHGVTVARRTVAKYRAEAGIPGAAERRA